MLFGVIRINTSDTGLVLLVRRLVVFPPVAILASLLAIFLVVVVAGLLFVKLSSLFRILLASRSYGIYSPTAATYRRYFPRY